MVDRELLLVAMADMAVCEQYDAAVNLLSPFLLFTIGSFCEPIEQGGVTEEEVAEIKEQEEKNGCRLKAEEILVEEGQMFVNFVIVNSKE